MFITFIVFKYMCSEPMFAWNQVKVCLNLDTK